MALLPTKFDPDSIANWWRDRFSRGSYAGTVISFLWIALLTVLIWLYAESQQSVESTPQESTLTLKIADGNRIVSRPGHNDEKILISLAGPNANVTQVKSMLGKSGEAGSIVVEVPKEFSDGVHQLPIEEQVRNAPIFSKNNVVAKFVAPQTISVAVDTLVEREFDVKTPPELKSTIESAVYVPQKIKLRGPRSVVDKAGDIQIYADVAKVPDFARNGTHDPAVVALRKPIDDENVTLVPNTVTVTLKTGQTLDSWKDPSVPVRLFMPPGLQNEASVMLKEGNDVVTNVTFVGPPDQIALLRDGKFVPFATLSIDRSDEFGKANSKQVVFLQLPPGVMVDAADRDRRIEFTLKKRDSQ